jgi:hypothetical protein
MAINWFKLKKHNASRTEKKVYKFELPRRSPSLVSILVVGRLLEVASWTLSELWGAAKRRLDGFERAAESFAEASLLR